MGARPHVGHRQEANIESDHSLPTQRSCIACPGSYLGSFYSTTKPQHWCPSSRMLPWIYTTGSSQPSSLHIFTIVKHTGRVPILSPLRYTDQKDIVLRCIRTHSEAFVIYLWRYLGCVCVCQTSSCPLRTQNTSQEYRQIQGRKLRHSRVLSPSHGYHRGET